MEDVVQFLVSTDAIGMPLEGGKKYKLLLPSEIPNVNFWSVIVYDKESQLMISTDQPWPSVYSSSKRLVINQDGSVDVRFGPNVSDDKTSIKTIPGKAWYMILRIYDPPASDKDISWRPGEIEEVK